MVEIGLSARRAPWSPRARAAGVAAAFGGSGDVDESKTRKHASFAARLAKNVTGMVAPTRPCLLAGFLFLLVLLVAVFIYLSPPRFRASPSFEFSLVDSVDGLDSIASEFGILGVPRCSSKHEKIVEWTSMDLLKGLEEFVPIYETRPIENNKDGMGFDHSFGLWFMTRWLKPDLMIESGVFTGHSTWVLRQAMPNAPIISILRQHPEDYLGEGLAYVDKNSTYFPLMDFGDFENLNWEILIMEKHGISDFSQVLVFFNDHQSHLKRLKQALKAGFQHIIFDNNYDTGTGDHYSLRQICDQYYTRGGGHFCMKDDDEARIRERRKSLWEKAVGIDELCGMNNAWWGIRGHMNDNFNLSSEYISYFEHAQNHRFAESVLDVYWELPPVAGPSLTHQTRYDPARAPNPIIEDGRFDLFQRLGLTRLEASVFNRYTQMVYLQISAPDSDR
ncbi:putative DNA-directed RNA polymerase subunit beta-like [Cocos nucifera]|uniref:Putative DNA-directed RNA polymerase subunit beta-like n=1 Tax=Cocos nucifera TaxID=13894 RepID=A0A8K0I4D8_COCNU|nr:putative DNA-directed RNA polymerase subunit beta-like [Cocos nucifera]